MRTEEEKVKKKKVILVRCLNCEHLTKVDDPKWFVRYKCKFAPDIEWLGGPCDSPLLESCNNYKKTYVDKSDESLPDNSLYNSW